MTGLEGEATTCCVRGCRPPGATTSPTPTPPPAACRRRWQLCPRCSIPTSAGSTSAPPSQGAIRLPSGCHQGAALPPSSSRMASARSSTSRPGGQLGQPSNLHAPCTLPCPVGAATAAAMWQQAGRQRGAVCWRRTRRLSGARVGRGPIAVAAWRRPMPSPVSVPVAPPPPPQSPPHPTLPHGPQGNARRACCTCLQHVSTS